MGFVTPRLPELDYEDWRRRPRMERVRPMVLDWAEHGFGPPESVYLLYVVKLVLYVVGAAFFASLTPGLGGLGSIGQWWTEPIVYQKVVIFTLVFEVLGLGCGFGPLTLRFVPPIGAFLYWLRPGTIRLAPWPTRVPGTAGSRRTVLDVGLYVAVVGIGIWLLLSPATVGSGGLHTAVGLLAPVRVVPLIAAVGLLGLRDKAIFLAARSEVYLLAAITFLFPPVDMIVAAKLVMLAIWWGAATSKLNHHFPNVVETMEANSPIVRSPALKRHLHQRFPDDIRPSGLARGLAHGGTVVEYSVPLVLMLAHGGPLTYVAATIMVLFHLHILSSLPLGVPLEWNVYMIYGICFLFVHEAHYGLGSLTDPLAVTLLVALMVVVVTVVIAGNFVPSKFSFLVSMRYYAGNWATSLWCLKPSAIPKLEAGVVAFPGLPITQLTKLYGEETADLLTHKGYAFRALHTHGRALFGLIERAAGPRHETDYIPMEGELIAGTTIGWNFGDGHLHDERLLAALQERCHFDEGEVRVIMLESQPMGAKTQEYRLVDAVSGEFERGTVAVADMLTRQPWAGEIPVTVTSGSFVSPAPSRAEIAGT